MESVFDSLGHAAVVRFVDSFGLEDEAECFQGSKLVAARQQVDTSYRSRIRHWLVNQINQSIYLV
jgi:hypothetical protein